GPVESMPRGPANQPHWNTATSTPYEAPIDSRFISAALIGMTIDRKTSVSTTTLRPITITKKSGNRLLILSPRSMVDAVWPPTYGRSRVPSVPAGVTVSPRRGNRPLGRLAWGADSGYTAN